ncbi:MAG TPA: amidohydrolase family protein [Rhizomicrobium sp.]|nr:amidohydrolase family protein [Rhizomicrobium sp.]
MSDEAVLDPDLPICDPHHHLYVWPGIGELGLPETYLLPEFLAEIASGGHNIESTVYLEATAFYRKDGPEELRTLGETEFATGVAAMSASGLFGATRVCEGIVGRVELIRGDAIGAVLEKHVAVGGDRFKGIRDAGPWDDNMDVPRGHTAPPKGLYEASAFRAGFAHLSRLGLSFDAWQYHPQLPQVIDLADAFPDTQIVLDHVGGVLGIGPYAGKADAVFAEWSKNIRKLAERPNVSVKLGGMGQPLGPFDHHTHNPKPNSEVLAAAWRPYVETCIDAFGVKRAMFESNFPVDGVACNYRALWNAMKRIAAGASADEKADLFRNTARTFYRLS